MEEYNNPNTDYTQQTPEGGSEEKNSAPGGQYYQHEQHEARPPRPSGKKNGGNRVAGYILVGMLCLLLGIAVGSCSTAVLLSGAKKAAQEAASGFDNSLEKFFDDAFGGFDFHFYGPGDAGGAESESDEYQEPEKKEYVGRELPEFDGIAPLISDPINPGPDIVQQVIEGVVGVNSYVEEKGEPYLEGYGSGFVVSGDGYIITNSHVIRGASKVTVTFFNSDEEVEAEVVGYDNTLDIAVLKVNKTGLTALALGDSDMVRVGEFTIAIGNPSGAELASTATFGIISATTRTVNIEGQTNDYIQTDAAINPGNSGGPLLNMKGEVVGITSAKNIYAGYDEYGNAVNAEGLGFAIPIREAMNVACQLITQGRVVRPGMGINVIEIDDEAAEYYDIHRGILVFSVTRNGPAHKAGVKKDDIVIKYDGREASSQEEFVNYVRTLKVGEELSLTVLRGDKELELNIVMGDMNELGSELVGGESGLFD